MDKIGVVNIRNGKNRKREQQDLLIEGCKAMAEDDLIMVREWETTDATLDWVW